MGYCFTSTSEQLSYGLILCQLIIIVMPTNATGLGPRSKAVGKVKFLDQVGQTLRLKHCSIRCPDVFPWF